MSSKIILRSIGILLFAVGVVLGLSLITVATWADLEAIVYGFDTIGGKPLEGLRCPVLMTTDETAHISITIKNPDDRRIEPLLRADISGPGLFREVRVRLLLEPGEAKEQAWAVTKEDIDLGFFVLAKVFTYASGSLPFREATCGILVLNLPGITGSQLLLIAGALILLGVVLGFLFWQSSNRPPQGRVQETAWAMRLLTGVILLGVLSSLVGWLLIAILTLVLSVLLLSAFAYFIVSSK